MALYCFLLILLILPGLAIVSRSELIDAEVQPAGCAAGGILSVGVCCVAIGKSEVDFSLINFSGKMDFSLFKECSKEMATMAQLLNQTHHYYTSQNTVKADRECSAKLEKASTSFLDTLHGKIAFIVLSTVISVALLVWVAKVVYTTSPVLLPLT